MIAEMPLKATGFWPVLNKEKRRPGGKAASSFNKGYLGLGNALALCAYS